MFGFYDSYFLFFGLRVTYYGLIIAFAIGLGVFLACKNAKLRGLKSDDVLIAACYIVPIAIVCARIYYVIFDERVQNFAEIFKIWDGGISIMGAVIGGAIGVALYCLIHKKNFLDVGDIVVPSLILGQALGRIGCYFAGCCYGIEVTNPKCMWFPLSTYVHGAWHLSTFFYESIWNLITFVVLMLLLRKFKLKQRGCISAWYLIIYGVGRAWIEALRGDSLMLGSIKVSILVSIFMVIAGIAILIFYFVRDKKTKSKVPIANNGDVIVEVPKESKETVENKENSEG